MTDADGRFRFRNLPAGTYKVGLSILRGTELKGWTNKESFRPGQTDVVVRSHDRGEGASRR